MQATLLVFVPPHALAAVLADAAAVLGAERRCVVARELTKVGAQQPEAPIFPACHSALFPLTCSYGLRRLRPVGRM